MVNNDRLIYIIEINLKITNNNKRELEACYNDSVNL